MSEKKVPSRGIAVGLGMVCVVLVAGLVGAIAYYTTMTNDRNASYNSYVSDHHHSDSEYDALMLGLNITQFQHQIDSLQNQIDNLNNDKNTLTNQVNSLQSQVNDLKAPRLILNLTSQIVAWYGGNGWINITGSILNAGSNTAYNTKLDVTYYQGAVATTSYVGLGSINAQSWILLREPVYYTGSAPTNVTITPQWTS